MGGAGDGEVEVEVEVSHSQARRETRLGVQARVAMVCTYGRNNTG